MDITSLLDFKTVGQYPVDAGGFCDVYRGRLHDGTIVALKVGRFPCDSDEDESPNPREKMHRVIAIWSECTHPNVVQLIGGATLQRGIAVVYEWLEYGGVIEYLKRHPAADRYQMSAQVCEGVAYLHANDIIHNSLKGTNVLVSSNGVPRIHLSLTTSRNSADDGLHGKFPSPNIRWAAPELLLAESSGTFASDVYALGMTILETMTMAIPYADQRDKHVVAKIMNRVLPSRPRDAIPDSHAGNALWNILCSCWSFDTADRPNAGQLLHDMRILYKTTSEIKSTSLPELAQRELLLVDAASLRLVVTKDTRIQDLVAYFEKRGLTDFTSVLLSNNITSTMPFADTALANVYKTSLPNQQYIAVKCVKHVTPYKKLKRAARELSCWLSHKHENILPVLGFAVVRGDLAMVSPWMSNGCVTDYVTTNPGCDRVVLCSQLARAIAYLHEHNVVHGDIKGANVLVSDSGTVKITDFGVSIMDHKEVEFSATSTSRGTQRWQAPEILLGESDSTKEGDVYALGMTLTEIYTGEPPYGLSTNWTGQAMIRIINGQLRPTRPLRLPLDSHGSSVWALMNHCWAGTPGERPTSGEVYGRLKGI
ncbi:kinase-like domain-containing protein [Rhizoctonia solani]|nr:kinase-like domain-containing protein [Rhizoctonia solani]